MENRQLSVPSNEVHKAALSLAQLTAQASMNRVVTAIPKISQGTRDAILGFI